MPVTIRSLRKNLLYASLLKYGKKKFDTGNYGGKRFTYKLVDGKYCAFIDGMPLWWFEEQLEKYDNSSYLSRFFQRVFTSIEKKRTLICYWAGLHVTKFMNIKLEQITDKRAQVSDIDAVALNVIAKHHHKLTSTMLRRVIRRSSFSVVISFVKSFVEYISPLRIATMFKATTPLSTRRHSESKEASVMPVFQEENFFQSSDNIWSQDVSRLKGFYNDTKRWILQISARPDLTNEKRKSEIKEKIVEFNRNYKLLLKENTYNADIKSQLKEVYENSVKVVENLVGIYDERYQNPFKELASIGKGFEFIHGYHFQKPWVDYENKLKNIFNGINELMAIMRPSNRYEAFKQEVHNLISTNFLTLSTSYQIISKTNPESVESAKEIFRKMDDFLAREIQPLKMTDLKFQSGVSSIDSWVREWRLTWKHFINEPLQSSGGMALALIPSALSSSLPLPAVSIAATSETVPVESKESFQGQFDGDLAELNMKAEALFKRVPELNLSEGSQEEKEVKAKQLCENEIKALTSVFRKGAIKYHPDKCSSMFEEGVAHINFVTWNSAYQDALKKFFALTNGNVVRSFGKWYEDMGEWVKNFKKEVVQLRADLDELVVSSREQMATLLDLSARIDKLCHDQEEILNRLKERNEQIEKLIGVATVLSGEYKEQAVVLAQLEQRLQVVRERRAREKAISLKGSNQAPGVTNGRFFSSNIITGGIDSEPDLTACVSPEQLPVDKLVEVRPSVGSLG